MTHSSMSAELLLRFLCSKYLATRPLSSSSSLWAGHAVCTRLITWLQILS